MSKSGKPVSSRTQSSVRKSRKRSTLISAQVSCKLECQTAFGLDDRRLKPLPHRILATGLKLLKPGKLVIAAYPNFYPVCHYAPNGDGAAKGSGARIDQGIPSTEEAGEAAAKPAGGCVGCSTDI